MENTLKNTIEKEKFKLKLVSFKPKVKALIGYSRGYFLEYKGKIIFLGLKRDVEQTFRALLKEVYGDIWFIDYPNSFFKDWIKVKFQIQVNATKQTNEKKQEYYKTQRVKQKKRKIEKLKRELKILEDDI